MLSLKVSNPGTPLLLHEELIYFGDKIIGRTTSESYSFNCRKTYLFRYINKAHTNVELSEMDLYIEVAKKKYLVVIKILPPKNKQTKFL